jgi:hypothetical protein
VRVSLCGSALDMRTHAHLVEISLQSLIAGKVNSGHPTLFSLSRNNGNVPTRKAKLLSRISDKCGRGCFFGLIMPT